MKKISKKIKYTGGFILLAILIIADARYSQLVKVDRENALEQSEVNVSEEPEPNLETFEDLQDEYEKEVNGSGKTVDEIDNTINDTYEDTEEENQNSGSGDASEKGSKVSGTEDSVGANKGKTVIIDESKETMKDETGNSEEKEKEKEYDVNQEPQGKVDLSSPRKTEKELGGRVVQDNTEPGGKQGVGVWS